jgi:hypothetical protein
MRALDVRPENRRVKAIGAAVGCVLLAGVMIVGVQNPVPLMAALLIGCGVIAVMRFPITALIVLLFVEPFHLAIFTSLNNVANVPTGRLVYWEDALIVALFARGVLGRFSAERRLRLPRDAGDSILLLYILGFLAIAVASPGRSTVLAALGRHIEGPMLLLAIRFLRPTRKQLWYCVGAVLGAATIMGTAAVIERLGPRIDFQLWYGAGPKTGGIFTSGGPEYRSGSFLNSPLVLGFYLAGAIPLAVAAATLRTRWRSAALVAATACTAGLITTVTRSGFIGAGIAVLLVLLLTVRNPGIRVSLIGMMLVIAGTTIISYIVQGNQSIVRSDSNRSHIDSLKRDLDLLTAEPFGYGLGTTDRFAQTAGARKNSVGITESTYFAKGLEGGVLGLALYLLALFSTVMRLRWLRRRALRARDGPGVALAAGALGTMTAIGLAGLFLGIHELAVEVLLWGVPGIALAWSVSGARPTSAPPRSSDTPAPSLAR